MVNVPGVSAEKIGRHIGFGCAHWVWLLETGR